MQFHTNADEVNRAVCFGLNQISHYVRCMCGQPNHDTHTSGSDQ